MRKSGFDLVSVTEPDLLQDDPSRKLMRQILGAIAEYEKTMIVMKLRGARNRMKARRAAARGVSRAGTIRARSASWSARRSLGPGVAYDKLAERLTAEGFKLRIGRSQASLGILAELPSQFCLTMGPALPP